MSCCHAGCLSLCPPLTCSSSSRAVTAPTPPSLPATLVTRHTHRGASFFVAGSAKRMPTDVMAAVKKMAR